jgi:hypothetical protein
MTASEWLTSSDPESMLKMILADASERQLRLFACACARYHWSDFDHARSREAIEVTERFADGLATEREHQSASNAARAVAKAITWTISEGWYNPRGRLSSLRALARDASQRRIKNSITQAVRVTLQLAYFDGKHGASMARLKELLCCYLRDIFSSQVAHIHPPDAIVLARNDHAVRHVAQSIYEDRDFARMPILGDALEDAGCDEEAILAHCRGAGPHVRGCWVLDLILGKN